MEHLPTWLTIVPLALIGAALVSRRIDRRSTLLDATAVAAVAVAVALAAAAFPADLLQRPRSPRDRRAPTAAPVRPRTAGVPLQGR